MINFVKKSKPGLSTVRFITTFPKKVFEDENMTLNDAKFGKSEALNVDAKWIGIPSIQPQSKPLDMSKVSQHFIMEKE